eukprot:353947-Amphidinium_carterae.1
MIEKAAAIGVDRSKLAGSTSKQTLQPQIVPQYQVETYIPLTCLRLFASLGIWAVPIPSSPQLRYQWAFDRLDADSSGALDLREVENALKTAAAPKRN